MSTRRALEPATDEANMAAKKKAPARQAATKTAIKQPRVFGMAFARVYPLYVQKAENKGRTKAEVDEVIAWLTGYSGKTLQRAIDVTIDFEPLFAVAPRINPTARLNTGVVWGVRIEDVADPLMQKIRYLDKLVDELAKGKKMASILRERDA